MHRREFLAALATPLFAAEGTTLVHEHVMVDFIGAGKIAPGRYDPDEVLRAAVPKLEEVKRLGCVRLLECTPQFLGRDAALMRRLSGDTGVEIWTNTGIYGAGDHKYVPEFAKRETAVELARRFISEFEHGIDGVKPRFIKTGVDKGPLDDLDRKLVRAAAIASRETGLAVASHTGDGAAALEQLEIVESENVPLSRFVWVHAQNEKDHAMHGRVARAGAWVEFDGIGEASIDWHLNAFASWPARIAGKNTHLAGFRLVPRRGTGRRPLSRLHLPLHGLPPPPGPGWIPALMRENPLQAFGG